MEELKQQEIMNELESIVEQLSELKNYKQVLSDDINEVKKTIGECTKLLTNFKSISEEFKTASSTLKQYSERIEALNKEFGYQLEDAKQIENRIMLDKMDLLLSKAEQLSARDKKAAQASIRSKQSTPDNPIANPKLEKALKEAQKQQAEE